VTLYSKGSASDVTPRHRSSERVNDKVDTGCTCLVLGGKQMERVRTCPSHESADKHFNKSRENAHSQNFAILHPLSPMRARAKSKVIR
jgi:hypothetical protein